MLVLAQSIDMEFSSSFTSVPQNDPNSPNLLADYSQTGVYGLYKDFDNVEIEKLRVELTIHTPDLLNLHLYQNYF